VKNAHERFGRLLYRRQTEKTATNLRVFLDAFVGEEQGKAHLVSVVGGDVEIVALAAAFANGDSFMVMDPCGKESIVSLGEKPLRFRGSITVSGRKRPLRHLVSCSQELADNIAGGKLVLVSDAQLFIWSSLVCHYGLPATPEWGPWMISQLQHECPARAADPNDVTVDDAQSVQASVGVRFLRMPLAKAGETNVRRTRNAIFNCIGSRSWRVSTCLPSHR